MPVARTLTPAVTLSVAGALCVFGFGAARSEWQAVEAAHAREMVAVGHQVRAMATALAPEVGLERAAALASEGLEGAFAGAWRWLHHPPRAGAPEDPLLGALPAPQQARLAAGELIRAELGEAGRERLYVYVPLPPDPRTGQGLVLEVSRSLDDLREARGQAARRLLVLGGLAVALATAATVLAGHLAITRPLRAVRDLARRAGQGDLGARLVPSGGGELTALGQDLNQMAERLAATLASVEARTREAERAAEQLRRAQRLASVGKLAAGIAHELGTPLNVVAARARSLTRVAAEPAEVIRLAGIIAGQAERMTAIVRQLLDYSRRRQPHLAHVDVAGLARAAVDLLEPQAGAAEVRIAVEAEEGLPAISADPAQLEQVLVNLLMNAIQASPGGGDVAVRVRRDRRARRPVDLEEVEATGGAPSVDRAGPELDVVRVDVTDRGVGIPRENLAHLFEPFFTTKGPGEGTGLGLPVAWGIVREHGGWLEVDSTAGEGATISVLLPIAKAENPS